MYLQFNKVYAVVKHLLRRVFCTSLAFPVNLCYPMRTFNTERSDGTCAMQAHKRSKRRG